MITTSDSTYNILKIDIADDIKTKIVNGKDANIFKFILRKNIVYEGEGVLVKEFVSYVKYNKVYNPIITCNDRHADPSTATENNTCNIEHLANEQSEFYIAFDMNLLLVPYTLYMNGELSIMYLLSQDALVAKKPTIKCDIIDAKNALKLHESDVHYFYKPSIITEENINDID